MPPRFDTPKAARLSWSEQRVLLQAFLRYYSRQKRLLVPVLIASVLTPAAVSAAPLLVLKALNDYLPAREITMLALCLSGVVLLPLFSAACEYVSARWGTVMGYRMEAEMRHDLFEHLQTLPFSYFDRERTGAIMSRLTNDLTVVAALAYRAPECIFSAILRFGLGLGIMLWINWRLALFALLPAPLLLLWFHIFQNRLRHSHTGVRQALAELNVCVENSIKGIRETQSFTNENVRLGCFDLKNKLLLKSQETLRGIFARFHAGMRLLLIGYPQLFIAIGVVLAVFGLADTAELLVFFMYSHSITHPLMMMVDLVDQYQQGMVAFERFRKVMETVPEIRDQPGVTEKCPPALRGELEISDLHFSYEPVKSGEPEVLNGISLHIAPGEKIALVGESGAGKSTLAALIPRFYEAVSGSIRLDGRDVREYPLEYLRRNIGIVSQSPFLFDTTLYENIRFGRADATAEEIREAARLANIHDFISGLPEQYNTSCGENGVRLSGGQRQRIAIARVFLKNPPLLILDEATSALDNESEALVQDAFGQLCRNRTTIVIAHRLSTVRNAARICCLKKGRIVEEGTHSALLERRGYYRRLYDRHLFQDLPES